MVAKTDLVFEWVNGGLRIGTVGWFVLIAAIFGLWRKSA